MYRHDILFRSYVLLSNAKDDWEEFCSLKSNRKVDCGKLNKIYKSIKRTGQLISVPVKLLNKDIFPAGGAFRIGSMIALNLETIKCEVIMNSSTRKWNDNITLDSHHFKGLSQGVLDRFNKYLENNVNCQWKLIQKSD